MANTPFTVFAISSGGCTLECPMIDAKMVFGTSLVSTVSVRRQGRCVGLQEQGLLLLASRENIK